MNTPAKNSKNKMDDGWQIKLKDSIFFFFASQGNIGLNTNEIINVTHQF